MTELIRNGRQLSSSKEISIVNKKEKKEDFIIKIKQNLSRLKYFKG